MPNKALILLITLLSVVSAFAANNEHQLYNFCRVNSCPDGFGPDTPLIFDSSGNLFGTASGGGAYGYGTVFRLTPGPHGKWTEKVLYSFNLTDGAFPVGGLVFDSAGNLYGTTYEGGAFYTCGENPVYGCGTVFQLTRSADDHWKEKVLHSFNARGKDGYWPFSGLIFDASGNLYGTTAAGGAYSCGGGGCGAVFQLRPSADGKWKEKVLHSFNGKDGREPGGLIFDADGNLYGTTYLGGPYNSRCGYYGCGTVFKLSPGMNDDWTEKVLHNFNFKDGSLPDAGLIFDASGDLYGTTAAGGAYSSCGAGSGCGTLFQLTPAANGRWKERVLHNFGKGKDGTSPAASLIFDATGNLYGTTTGGGAYGSSCSIAPCGTVFRLTLGGNGKWGETVLHSFRGVDGSDPNGALILDAAGNLYGTAGSGGAYGGGAVFEITP